MIPVTNSVLFQDALSCLRIHKQSVGQGFKGRFIQVFLGLKFFQNSLPSMFAGSFVTTEVLQALLDDLYAKVSQPANHCVLSLFEGTYLARTGLVAPGNKGAQNTWRNNFNLQKGIGCYAPPSDLSSPTFLNEDRSQCRYLQTSLPGSLNDARCSLCLSGAGYRGESHRKWLRIDPGGNGYAVTDLQNTPNFAPYVAPSGSRIPVLPLIVALYHDADPALTLGSRTRVQLADFITDFNFSQNEFVAYFDDSTRHPLNAQLTRSAAWPRGASVGRPLPSQPPAMAARSRRTSTRGSRTMVIPPSPNLTGTPAPPPNTNTGWEAEQYVAAALTAAGWTVYIVTRQQLGYDIFAQKGSKKRYVEVKSSLGLCSPLLTAREWQQASYHLDSYVLAVVENFDPIGQNMVYWIPDPANRCVATPQTTISQSIARSSWVLAIVPINQL